MANARELINVNSRVEHVIGITSIKSWVCTHPVQIGSCYLYRFICTESVNMHTHGVDSMCGVYPHVRAPMQRGSV